MEDGRVKSKDASIKYQDLRRKIKEPARMIGSGGQRVKMKGNLAYKKFVSLESLLLSFQEESKVKSE